MRQILKFIMLEITARDLMFYTFLTIFSIIRYGNRKLYDVYSLVQFTRFIRIQNSFIKYL